MKASEVLRRHRTKRRHARLEGRMMPLEPVEPSHRRLMEMLRGIAINGADPEDRHDEATVAALRALGLRIVWSCQLCAEPLTGRIPACPNVATVTLRETRERGLLGQRPTHVCQPHARGRKVYT